MLPKNVSTDSLKQTTRNATADLIRKFYDPNNEGQVETHRQKRKQTREGSSQSEVPVLDIIDGIVVTDDSRYIGYVEVKPVNFTELTVAQQSRAIDSYKSLFKNGPRNMQFFILSDTSNPQAIIRNAKQKCKSQDNQTIQSTLKDYIVHIKKLGSGSSVSRRFFIAFEYDPSMTNGRTNDKQEIVQSMREMRAHIESVLRSCGNVCNTTENRTNATAEFLYGYYNRLSSKKEPFVDRYNHVMTDFKQFNERYGLNKEPSFADVLAPKGLKFINRNCIYQDGLYYGYIGLNGDKWPERVIAGKWIECLYWDVRVDVVILSKRLPHDLTMISLRQMNRMTKQTAYEKAQKGNIEGRDNAIARLQHNTVIANALSSGEELSDVGIVLVVKATTKRQLGITMREILKDLKDMQLEGIESFLTAEDYYRMTSPFLCFTKPFGMIKHNTLSCDLATTYMYTSFELYDQSGFVLGINSNDSLVAINNFNRDYFANANTLLLGKSGAGKTFTLQLIAGRMFLTGIRCFFIIPKKGYEYKRGCVAHAGTYVHLVPGSADCLNILAIRPEGQLDRTMVGDEVLVKKGSLLAKKVNNIIMWISLHLSDDRISLKEFNALNTQLYRLYAEFGITDDDNSIYENIQTKTLKKMPIIGDMCNLFKSDPLLDRICDLLQPYISGNCSNMNGQTNVDLDNNYIVFDVDEDLIGDALLPAFLYLAFDHVYSEVKEKDKSKDAIILDEVWKMMTNKDCAKQVQNAIKLVRGYGGCTLIATQELSDFLNSGDNFGKSVLNNTEIRIILGMKELDLDLVRDTLKITQPEYDSIIKFDQGTALLLTNKARITVRMEASKAEFDNYNTDVDQRLST